MKADTVTIKGGKRTTIKCGSLVIKDKGKPYTTSISVDGKPLADVFIITKLKYEVNIQTGEAKLQLSYYPRVNKK